MGGMEDHEPWSTELFRDPRSESVAEPSSPTLIWASGSVVGGVVGPVTTREWEPEVESADEYAREDAEDGIIAITVTWRPGAREVEIDVLGTEEGAVAAAWDFEAEEAARKTLV